MIMFYLRRVWGRSWIVFIAVFTVLLMLNSKIVFSGCCVPTKLSLGVSLGYFSCHEAYTHDQCGVGVLVNPSDAHQVNFSYNSDSCVNIDICKEYEICNAQGQCYNVSKAVCNALKGSSFNVFSLNQGLAPYDEQGMSRQCDQLASVKNITFSVICNSSGNIEYEKDIDVYLEIGSLSWQGKTDEHGKISFLIYQPKSNVIGRAEFTYASGQSLASELLFDDSGANFTYGSINEYSSYPLNFIVNFCKDLGFYGTVNVQITKPNWLNRDFIVGSSNVYTKVSDVLTHGASLRLAPGFITLYAMPVGYPPFLTSFELSSGEIKTVDVNYSAILPNNLASKRLYGYVIDNVTDNVINKSVFVFVEYEFNSKKHSYSYYDDNGFYNISLFLNTSFSITFSVDGYKDRVVVINYDDLSNKQYKNISLLPIVEDTSCDPEDYFVGTVKPGAACVQPCYRRFVCDHGTCKFFEPITLAKHAGLCDGNFFCNEHSECVPFSQECAHVTYSESNSYPFQPGVHSQKANCVLAKHAYCNGSNKYQYFDLSDSIQRQAYCSVCGHDSVCTNTTCDLINGKLNTYEWKDNAWQSIAISYSINKQLYCNYCSQDGRCASTLECVENGFVCCPPEKGVGEALPYNCGSGLKCFVSCQETTCPKERIVGSDPIKALYCRAKGGIITNNCCSVKVDDYKTQMSCPQGRLLNKNILRSLFAGAFFNYSYVSGLCFCGGTLYNASLLGNRYCCDGHLQASSCDTFRIDVTLYYSFLGNAKPYNGQGDLLLIDTNTGSVVQKQRLDGTYTSTFKDVSPGNYKLQLLAYLGNNVYEASRDVVLVDRDITTNLTFNIDVFFVNVSGYVMNEMHSPVVGARVKVFNLESIANDQGYYFLPSVLFGGSLRFLVMSDCDGLNYQPLEELVTPDLSEIFSNNILEKNFTLKARPRHRVIFNLTWSTNLPLEGVNITLIDHSDGCYKKYGLRYSVLTNSSGLASLILPCNFTYRALLQRDNFSSKIVDFTVNCNDNNRVNVRMEKLLCKFDKGNIDIWIKSISYKDLTVTLGVKSDCKPDQYLVYANISSGEYKVDQVRSEFDIQGNVQGKTLYLGSYSGDSNEIVINLKYFPILDVPFRIFVVGEYFSDSDVDSYPSTVVVSKSEPSSGDWLVFYSWCKLGYDYNSSLTSFCFNLIKPYFVFDDDLSLVDGFFQCNYTPVYTQQLGVEKISRVSANSLVINVTAPKPGEVSYYCKQTLGGITLYSTNNSLACDSLLNYFAFPFYYLNVVNVSFVNGSYYSKNCTEYYYLARSDLGIIHSLPCYTMTSCYDTSLYSCRNNPCLPYNCKGAGAVFSHYKTFDICKPVRKEFSQCWRYHYLLSKITRAFSLPDNQEIRDSEFKLCKALGDCTFYFDSNEDSHCVNSFYQPNSIQRTGGKVNLQPECNALGSVEPITKDIASQIFSHSKDYEKFNAYICYYSRLPKFGNLEKVFLLSDLTGGLTDYVSTIKYFDFAMILPPYIPDKNQNLKFLNVSISVSNLGTDSLLYNQTCYNATSLPHNTKIGSLILSYNFSDIVALYHYFNPLLIERYNISRIARSLLYRKLDLCSYSEFQNITGKNVFLLLNISTFDNQNINDNVRLKYVDCVKPKLRFLIDSKSHPVIIGTQKSLVSDVNITVLTATPEFLVRFNLSIIDNNGNVKQLYDVYETPINTTTNITLELDNLTDGTYTLAYYAVDVVGNSNHGDYSFTISADKNLIVFPTSTFSSGDLMLNLSASSDLLCRWSFNNLSLYVNSSGLKHDFSTGLINLTFKYIYPDEYRICRGCAFNVSYAFVAGLRIFNVSGSQSLIELEIRNSTDVVKKVSLGKVSNISVKSSGYVDYPVYFPIHRTDLSPGKYNFSLKVLHSSNFAIYFVAVVQQNYPFVYSDMPKSNEILLSYCRVSGDTKFCSVPINLPPVSLLVPVAVACYANESTEHFYIGSSAHVRELAIDTQKPYASLKINNFVHALYPNSYYVSDFLENNSLVRIYVTDPLILGRVSGRHVTYHPGSFGSPGFVNVKQANLLVLEKNESHVIYSLSLPKVFCGDIQDVGGNKLENICVVTRIDTSPIFVDFSLNNVYPLNSSTYLALEDYLNVSFVVIDAEDLWNEKYGLKKIFYGDLIGTEYVRNNLIGNQSLLIVLRLKNTTGVGESVGLVNYRVSEHIAGVDDIRIKDYNYAWFVLSKVKNRRIHSSNIDSSFLFADSSNSEDWINFNLTIDLSKVAEMYVVTIDNRAMKNSITTLGNTHRFYSVYGTRIDANSKQDKIFSTLGRVKLGATDKLDVVDLDKTLALFGYGKYNISTLQRYFTFFIDSIDTKFNTFSKQLDVIRDLEGPFINGTVGAVEYGDSVNISINVFDEKYTQLALPYHNISVHLYILPSLLFAQNSYYGFDCNKFVGYCKNNEKNLSFTGEYSYIMLQDLDPGYYCVYFNYSCSIDNNVTLFVYSVNDASFKQQLPLMCGNRKAKYYCDYYSKKDTILVGFRQNSSLNLTLNQLLFYKSYYHPFFFEWSENESNDYTYVLSLSKIFPHMINFMDKNALGYYSIGVGNYTVIIEAEDYFGNLAIKTMNFSVIDTRSPIISVNWSLTGPSNKWFTRNSTLKIVINSSEPLVFVNVTFSLQGKNKSFRINMVNDCSELPSMFVSECNTKQANYYYGEFDYSKLKDILGKVNKVKFNVRAVGYDFSLNPSNAIDIQLGADTVGVTHIEIPYGILQVNPVYMSSKGLIIARARSPRDNNVYYNISVCVVNSTNVDPFNSNQCLFYNSTLVLSNFNVSEIECGIINYSIVNGSITAFLNKSSCAFDSYVYSTDPYLVGHVNVSAILTGKIFGRLNDKITLYRYPHGLTDSYYNVLLDWDLFNRSGDYYVFVCAVDEFGQNEFSCGVVNVSVDFKSPNITLLNPVPNADNAPNNQIQIKITDDHLNVSSIKVVVKRLTENNYYSGVWQTYTFDSGKFDTLSSLYSLNPSDFGDTSEFALGQYNITVYAEDLAGNMAIKQYRFSFANSTHMPQIICLANCYWNSSLIFYNSLPVKFVLNFSDPRDMDSYINITSTCKFIRSTNSSFKVTCTKSDLVSGNKILFTAWKVLNSSSSTKNTPVVSYQYYPVYVNFTSFYVSGDHYINNNSIILSVDSSLPCNLGICAIKNYSIVLYKLKNMSHKISTLTNSYLSNATFYVDDTDFLNISLHLLNESLMVKNFDFSNNKLFIGYNCSTCRLFVINQNKQQLVNEIVFDYSIQLKGKIEPWSLGVYNVTPEFEYVKVEPFDGKLTDESLNSKLVFDYVVDDFPLQQGLYLVNLTICDLFEVCISQSYYFVLDILPPEISMLNNVVYVNNQSQVAKINVTEK